MYPNSKNPTDHSLPFPPPPPWTHTPPPLPPSPEITLRPSPAPFTQLATGLSLSLTPLCLFLLTLSPLSRTPPFIGKLQIWKRNYTSGGDRKLNRSGNARVSV
ncbi:hypothetical protein HanRHA438_Chr05g0235261 [Helianthus annuus]|uniref:Uncharacterized protein n=1 Tax=Helianthus annuus TaxID=4232 RepID=A0A9K3J1W8_HELAN|nr:hypothetical protein HanXRQr2_Chr05g0226271 [Helianthus annuus]KAJ0919929.1 hypothetical protein HanRHA438_Chr05g0235261 [Helianthus annuus]KAJ0923632.1 hypothetical protein HanPSC8_Chr05g0218351 [Helianthus annuus]